jgi:hypothetical protein
MDCCNIVACSSTIFTRSEADKKDLTKLDSLFSQTVGSLRAAQNAKYGTLHRLTWKIKIARK